MADPRPPAPFERPSLIRDSLTDGLKAGRRNLVPAVGIVLLAGAIVAAYHHWDPARQALEAVRGYREAVGLPFGIVSTAIFGGIIPMLVKRLVLREAVSLGLFVFGTLFWAYKGLEVALLYEFQAWLWGEGSSLSQIIAKVFVDQAIYNPLLAVPNMLLGYLWADCGFSFRNLRAALNDRGYWVRALPILISNTAVWLPTVALIYVLPTALQLPVQNLVLVGWVLLLTLLARREREA
jgi:hypothetical protein